MCGMSCIFATAKHQYVKPINLNPRTTTQKCDARCHSVIMCMATIPQATFRLHLTLGTVSSQPALWQQNTKHRCTKTLLKVAASVSPG